MPLQIAASLANLLWLNPVPESSRAGCAGQTDAPLVAALARHLPGIRTDAPYPDGSLEFFALLSEVPLSGAAFKEAARTTASGGIALLVGPAEHRVGEARRLRRTARNAGFSELRLYRIAGSLEHPEVIVPARPTALESVARATSRPGPRGWFRRLALRLGVVPPAYGGFALVGKRALTTDRTTLLRAVGTVTGHPPRWNRLVLLQNVAPVPALTSDAADTLQGRGFHLAVTDWRGCITHHLKCRPAGDPRALREASLLEELVGTPAAACVPRAQVFHGVPLQVVALEAVRGERLDNRLRRRTADQAPEDAAHVLRTMGQIRAAAGPAPRQTGFDAGLELNESIKTLERHGLEGDTIARLRTVPPGVWSWIPQHGDLWPNNVIWSATGPVLLDFEAFGEVGHPMFDAWHLLRTSHRAIGAQATWLDSLSPHTVPQRKWREVLREAQKDAGAPGADLRAGLLWYVSHMAAILLRRGVPDEYSQPYVEDVRRVAELLG